MYDDGLGGTKDLGEAVRWYRLAATQGSVDAAFTLARLLCRGKDPKDLVEAAHLFRHAAEHGSDDAEIMANAQYALAQMHHLGQGLPRDQSEALRLAGLAADQGHEDARRFVERWASEFRSGSNPEHAPRRLVEAERAFRRAEQEGDADKSVLAKLEDAWLMAAFAAARELYGPAQLLIGRLYRQGHRFVMMQSDEEAAQWYRRAGIGKMAKAQVALAECYEAGRGVVQSDEEAARWYGYAATEVHPDAEAQYVVGGFYLRGVRGKPKDVKEAFHFFRLAAAQGHTGAHYTIGFCLLTGKYGVAQDIDTGRGYLLRAADAGHAGARDLLDSVARILEADAAGR